MSLFLINSAIETDNIQRFEFILPLETERRYGYAHERDDPAHRNDQS